jgi:hypothetical protein
MRPYYPRELDRGRAINLISPEGLVSKNCIEVTNSVYLAAAKKVTISQYGRMKTTIS